MAKKRKRQDRSKGRRGGKPATSQRSADNKRDDVGTDDERDTTGTSDDAPRTRAQRRAAEREAAKVAKREARTGNAGGTGPAPRPVFWFGFEVPWAKVAVTRFAIFGLLALDALLQIRHAPRYGSDFNVANLGFLDHLGPGRISYGVGQLLVAYLLSLAAFGIATRVALPIATAIYAWLYFGSQLDSYQHHYLVSIVLALACFVPWQRPPDAGPDTRVRSWALRLILVELGIMYLWAAISKLDPVWLDGTTLSAQIGGSLRSMIESTVGFHVAASLVVVVEITLAFAVWIKPGWLVAAPLGVMFHLGIIATGFEIGLFAYIMLALYLLVIPDRVWVAIGRPIVELGNKLDELFLQPGAVTTALAIAVAIGLAWLVRLPNAVAVAVALAVFPIGAAIRRITTLGGPPIAGPAIVHVLAIVLWLVVDRSTTVTEDYYRFWGGSQRRLGDMEQAEEAYRHLVEVAPDDDTGHYYLGRILLADDRTDEGLAELHEAQRADPHLARAFVAEARWLAMHGRRAEAIAKAQEAVAAESSDRAAHTLLDALTKPPSKPTP